MTIELLESLDYVTEIELAQLVQLHPELKEVIR